MSWFVDEGVLELNEIEQCRECGSDDLVVDKDAGTHVGCVGCGLRQLRYERDRCGVSD